MEKKENFRVIYILIFYFVRVFLLIFGDVLYYFLLCRNVYIYVDGNLIVIIGIYLLFSNVRFFISIVLFKVLEIDC